VTKRNIVHIEIPSANFEQSGKFFSQMFGWKITPMPEANYSLWEPAQGPGGGFNPLSAETKVGEVLIYVDSDDIDADLKKARSLGAAVLKEKTEIPNMGWFAILKDPTGNAIALFTDMHPEPAK
jgi:predicted enzyme related to lactoylglutathione lyase